MKLQRKPFLINRAISKFLTASVFSAVAIQLAVMVDAIVVANFVGPDAMSAISVCMPVIGIIVNIGYLISMGGTLLISVWVVRYSYRRPSGRTTWNTAVI